MSANRFDTPRVDAIKEAAAVETFASSKASVGSAELIAESLSMTDAQTLQNEAFANILIGLVDQLTVNQSTITEKLSSTDVSMNVRTNDTMNKLDIIIQTLSSNSVVSENKWSEILNNLNVKSNDTQQTMIDYISKYIVIPLYEQRLNDNATIYHNFLEKQALEN